MGKPIRKRVRALRRAPDGSAFQKCENCGILVAVAIADMHECQTEKDFLKRCKTELIKERNNVNEEKMLELQAQTRSAFRFFMECFVESSEAINQFDVDTKGFETWRNMSKHERLPYVLQAEKVNSEYERALLQEVKDMSWVNEEADSAEVGRNMTFLHPLMDLMALRAYFGEQVKALSPRIDYCCVHELFVKIVEF